MNLFLVIFHALLCLVFGRPDAPILSVEESSNIFPRLYLKDIDASTENGIFQYHDTSPPLLLAQHVYLTLVVFDPEILSSFGFAIKDVVITQLQIYVEGKDGEIQRERIFRTTRLGLGALFSHIDYPIGSRILLYIPRDAHFRVNVAFHESRLSNVERRRIFAILSENSTPQWKHLSRTLYPEEVLASSSVDPIYGDSAPPSQLDDNFHSVFPKMRLLSFDMHQVVFASGALKRKFELPRNRYIRIYTTREAIFDKHDMVEMVFSSIGRCQSMQGYVEVDGKLQVHDIARDNCVLYSTSAWDSNFPVGTNVYLHVPVTCRLRLRSVSKKYQAISTEQRYRLHTTPRRDRIASISHDPLWVVDPPVEDQELSLFWRTYLGLQDFWDTVKDFLQ